ncbi:saccharopine dehydrogenase NADP-binding domain-containing protein [Inquilinus limosus]|uniref:homospermidine synthase n=1 Tax=Inquilinus limosus TaxID=171674 RepID=UPI003F162986
MTQTARTPFAGRILMVGFGSIGQGVLPLLMRHLTLTSDRVTIVTAETRGQKEAELYGVRFILEPVTRSNFRTLLEPLLGPGDALVNLSVDVSSVELIKLARERGALYLDTCIEPWLGGYTDPNLGPADRSNYALREAALALGRSPGAPTAVLTHGANPGLVSHFVKRALLDIAAATGFEPPVPADRAGWAALAQRLGVKVIHIAERDTQVARYPKKPGEFVNTWSIDGFVGEGSQPAELGWGSHERHFPADGNRHASGSQAAIWLSRPGATTRVRTWTPLAGPIHGFLITHNEAISLADYLTVGSGANPEFRPTVHYAYHPSDDAVLSVHEFAGRNFELQPEKRLMMDEITEGMDELGVLLAGHAKGAYWYGSRLTIGEARELAPHNNATSLQVTSAVLAGLVWAIENPDRGLIEPEDMDHERVLAVAAPYLGELAGAFTDWTPLEGRGKLFPEDVDTEDPWQFKNIRVV